MNLLLTCLLLLISFTACADSVDWQYDDATQIFGKSPRQSTYKYGEYIMLPNGTKTMIKLSDKTPVFRQFSGQNIQSSISEILLKEEKNVYSIGKFAIASIYGEDSAVPTMHMVYSDDVINVLFVSLFGVADIHPGSRKTTQTLYIYNIKNKETYSVDVVNQIKSKQEIDSGSYISELTDFGSIKKLSKSTYQFESSTSLYKLENNKQVNNQMNAPYKKFSLIYKYNPKGLDQCRVIDNKNDTGQANCSDLLGGGEAKLIN
ncbi:MAG: hypothetical protein KGO49_12120 [Gammaproteobacteria bacterium]|nr:hypothetical protein [Gammaproteobacteria bacterium]